MNIEMGRQTAIDAIIAAVKDFKRTGERIADLVRHSRNQEALVLLDQQEQTALQIQGSLKTCEEGYLNPEVAKKLMIMRNQFKEERNKLARLFHAARVEPAAPEQESDNQEEEGFDYEVESRLLREKEESLTQVHKKITNIQSVMLETQEMTLKQGEHLDLIGENLNTTKDNAVKANSNLQEANKHSASHNRRCLCLITITLALLLVIVSAAIFICSQQQLTNNNSTEYLGWVTRGKMGLIFLREREVRCSFGKSVRGKIGMAENGIRLRGENVLLQSKPFSKQNQQVHLPNPKPKPNQQSHPSQAPLNSLSTFPKNIPICPRLPKRHASAVVALFKQNKSGYQMDAEFVYTGRQSSNINNKQMFKYLFLVLALSSALAQDGSDDYFLSPPLPPTAYLGQYYTVQFRVIGVDNPVFSFEGVPACLKPSPDGTIEGTPDKIGSFAVKLFFKSRSCSGSRDIVIRVAPSVASTERINSEAGVTSVNQFIVVNSNKALTYLVGDKIDFSLDAKNGKAPYTWNFLNLPSQLTADRNGRISGVFSQEGYYSFSASANDGSGANADSYFTFNIQPKSVAKQSVLIEVPDRNVPVRYDLQQVEAQQLAAENAVFAAIKIVNNRQNESTVARSALAKTTLALQFATAQEDAAQANAGKALRNKNSAAAAESRAHELLQAAQKIVDLSRTNYKNSQDVTKNAKDNLHDAEEVFEKATAALKTANNKFINAQTEAAQAAQNTKASITSNLNSRNVYNLAFNTYSEAKKQLQVAQSQKQQADTVVATARNAVNLVNQINDNAQAALTTSQNVYTRSYSALNNANALVSHLQEELGDASDQLGVAKFNLQQAMNNLFVAQARKEQADKATAIVRAQSSRLPAEDSTSTYIFSGCNQQAYPTIAGSALVSEANRVGYQLSSGNTLVFGDCTQRDVSVKKGDIISYNGYLKDGYVHCISYSKAK